MAASVVVVAASYLNTSSVVLSVLLFLLVLGGEPIKPEILKKCRN